MLQYYKENINKVIMKIVNNPIEIRPIGHHDINRHLVYYVKNLEGEEYAVKFYFKINRYNRELFNFLKLSKYGVEVPRVFDHGVFEDGTEWIKSEYVDGIILEEIFTTIKRENLLELYEEIGEQLGKLHSSMEFDYVVDFNSKQEVIKRYEDYYNLMNYYLDDAIEAIRRQNLEEMELFERVYRRLKEESSMLKNINKLCLCHNDFGKRNIIVSKRDDDWKIAAVIDFENCISCDKDFELVMYYLGLRELDYQLSKYFRIGYEKYLIIDDSALEMKKKFYRLYSGLEICSWAKERAPDYYDEGLRYIKDSL